MSAPTDVRPNLHTLEDVIGWAYHHDAQVQAWWVMQFKANEDIERRLGSIEGRAMRWVGAASMVGTLLGGGILGLLFL